MTDLERVLMGYDNFETQNFEEHADAIAASSPSPTALAVKQSNGMIKHVGNVVKSSTWDALVINSKGDLNITIRRMSANIASPLPFVLFGSNDFQAGYIQTLNPLVAALGVAGLTYAVTTDAATGDILITYTLAAEVDVVRIINIGQASMRAFLAGMNNNYFKTMNFLVSINDENYNVQQFGQVLYFGLLSTLGLTGTNQLIFRSRTNSWMFRKDRVEVLVPEQKIVPEYSFSMNIIAIAGFEVGMDFFMSERSNLNNVK